MADALRPLAPPVVYTGTRCKQRSLWMQGNMEGSTRSSTDRQCTVHTEHPPPLCLLPASLLHSLFCNNWMQALHPKTFLLAPCPCVNNRWR